MPYKSEKIKIQGTMLDRRKKLTDNDRSKIVDLYKTTGISIHSLAKEFNVSRRTIQLVLFPDRLEKANVEDTIIQQEEMDEFIDNNDIREVLSWNYSYSNNELYMDIGE